MSDVTTTQAIVREHNHIQVKNRHTTLAVVGIAVLLVLMLTSAILIQSYVFSRDIKHNQQQISDQQNELAQATQAILKVCDEVSNLGGTCPKIVIQPPKH